MKKPTALELKFQEGLREGLLRGKALAKGLRAQQEIDAFNRGVQRGQQLTEEAKAGGIADLQMQLDAARKETGRWKIKHRRLVSTLFEEITRDD